MTAVIERNPSEAEYYETRAMYRPFAGDPQGAKSDRAQAAKLRQNASADKGAESGKEEHVPSTGPKTAE